MFAHLESADRDLRHVLKATRAGSLSTTQMGEMLTFTKALDARVKTLQCELAGAIAARDDHGDGGALMLRNHAGRTPRDSKRQVATTEGLDALPEVADAVDAGKLGFANAATLADAAGRTSAEAVNAATDLRKRAEQLPPDMFAKEAARWVSDHQPDGGVGEQDRHYEERAVRFWEGEDGAVHVRGNFDREWAAASDPTSKTWQTGCGATTAAGTR